VMPDVHAGIGSTVGTVIATHKAIIPAAVGVDIGYGMNAVRMSLKASDLPDSLAELRHDIERSVPLGAGGAHRDDTTLPVAPPSSVQAAASMRNAGRQLGTLGSGNHFIEICLDENDDVWVVLHSGSRGIGNQIGRFYIEKARKLMERYFITLPDGDLAYLPEDTDDFSRLRRSRAVGAGVRAREPATPDGGGSRLDEASHPQALHRHAGSHQLSSQLRRDGEPLRQERLRYAQRRDPRPRGRSRRDTGIDGRALVHRARQGQRRELLLVLAWRRARMSRSAARKAFTVADLAAQTQGVECRKDDAVLDEIPGVYKDIREVMAAQEDLVEIVRQFDPKIVRMCGDGSRAED